MVVRTGKFADLVHRYAEEVSLQALLRPPWRGLGHPPTSHPSTSLLCPGFFRVSYSTFLENRRTLSRIYRSTSRSMWRLCGIEPPFAISQRHNITLPLGLLARLGQTVLRHVGRLVGDSGYAPLHLVYKTNTLLLHQSPACQFPGPLWLYYNRNFLLCQLIGAPDRSCTYTLHLLRVPSLLLEYWGKI